MTFEEKKENTLGVCGLFGDNIVLHEKAAGKNVRLLSVTGKEIISNIDEIIRSSEQFSPFTLIFYSSLYSYILHDRTHDIKDKLWDGYGDFVGVAEWVHDDSGFLRYVSMACNIFMVT